MPTRNFVPRNDTEGEIGTATKRWKKGNFSGDMNVGGELTIIVYSQDSEPTLDTDNKLAMWIDTNDSNKVYIIFRRGSGDQVKVELT
jgi:hypothetical protein